jgi:hypothetical protein
MSFQIHKTVKFTDILRYYDRGLARSAPRTTIRCHNPYDHNLLRHGTDGFISPPKDFFARKIRQFNRYKKGTEGTTKLEKMESKLPKRTREYCSKSTSADAV